MEKIRFNVVVESPVKLNNEQKMEVLADIRNALRNFTRVNSHLKVKVSRELTNEDIMESLSSSKKDKRYVFDCKHYDEAQGRMKCVNPLINNNFCMGVCDNYEDK